MRKARRAGMAALAGLFVALAAVPASATVTVPDPSIVTDPRFDWDAHRQQLARREHAARAPSSALGGGVPDRPDGTAHERATGKIRRVAGVRRHVAKSTGPGGATPGRVVMPQGVEQPASGKFGRIARGAGTAAAAFMGVDLVYQAFTQDEYFGYGGLFGVETNGIVCDLSDLFTGQRNCGVTGAEGYWPNQDVSELVPGWEGGNNVLVAHSSGWPMAQIRVDILDAPDYGASMAIGTEYTFRAVLTIIGGQCTNGGWVTPSASGGYHVVQEDGTARDVTGQLHTSTGLGNDRWLGYPDCGSTQQEIVWDKVIGNHGSNVNRGIYAGWVLTGSSHDGKNGTTIRWLPEGHPDRVDIGEDPARHWLTEYRCQDGTTGSVRGADWHESDAEWPAPEGPGCPDPEWIRVSQITPGLEPYVLYEYERDPAVDAWAAEYPECADGSCLLELHRVDPATGTRTACFDNPEACTNWLEAPNRDTDYACTYGNRDVSLRECYVYGPTFDRDKAGTSTHGDPEDGSIPEGVTPPAPAPDTSCPPPFEFTLGGIGYWVTQGTLCALKMAFVPNSNVVAHEVGQTTNAVTSRPPFSLVAPVTGVFTGLMDGWNIGCEGNVADFDPWEQGRLAFPCTPPQSAPLTALYGLCTLAIVASTGFYVWRLLVSAMNSRGGEA